MCNLHSVQVYHSKCRWAFSLSDRCSVGGAWCRCAQPRLPPPPTIRSCSAASPSHRLSNSSHLPRTASRAKTNQPRTSPALTNTYQPPTQTLRRPFSTALAVLRGPDGSPTARCSHVAPCSQPDLNTSDAVSCCSYASPQRGAHGATLAARLSARWTTTRGLRELTDPHRLKLVLEMCIVAARHELATPEQAAALVDHMQSHPVRPRPRQPVHDSRRTHPAMSAQPRHTSCLVLAGIQVSNRLVWGACSDRRCVPTGRTAACTVFSTRQQQQACQRVHSRKFRCEVCGGRSLRRAADGRSHTPADSGAHPVAVADKRTHRRHAMQDCARMDLVAIVLDLTVRLRPAGGRAAVLALLSAVQRHHGDSPEALPCTSTDAALVLHRMLRLSLHEPLPGGPGPGQRDTGGAAAGAEAPALTRLLTWRVAAVPGDIHPALLVRAMHASSQLLGFVFVPLMKVRPRRCFPAGWLVGCGRCVAVGRPLPLSSDSVRRWQMAVKRHQARAGVAELRARDLATYNHVDTSGPRMRQRAPSAPHRCAEITPGCWRTCGCRHSRLQHTAARRQRDRALTSACGCDCHTCAPSQGGMPGAAVPQEMCAHTVSDTAE